jgi:hypothetical protein
VSGIAGYYLCWETQCIAAETDNDLVFVGKILFRLIFACMDLLALVAGWSAIAKITLSAATGRALVVSNGKRTVEELPDGAAHIYQPYQPVCISCLAQYRTFTTMNLLEPIDQIG